MWGRVDLAEPELTLKVIFDGCPQEKTKRELTAMGIRATCKCDDMNFKECRWKTR